MLRKLARRIFELVLIVAILLLSYTLIYKLPQIRRDAMRRDVGPKVVMLTNETDNSGGTGFLVKAPSGQIVILTNRHICELAENERIKTHFQDGTVVYLKVLKRGNFADLCVLKAPKFATEGLNVADSVRIGQLLTIVGHPKLMPLTVTNGDELIGEGKIQVLVAPGPCSEPGGMFSTETIPPFGEEVCVMTVRADFTNVLALPGNSGSPVLDEYHNVVGVLFAGSTDNWSYIVRLIDIKRMLKGF